MADGFWVDESISTVALPRMESGCHELIITQEVRHDTTREWCYLLGDFGVTLDSGRQSAQLGTLPEFLASGDLVPQGLPFYAGSVDMEFEIALGQAGRYQLELGRYNAPLVTVSVDGDNPVQTAFPPLRR